MLLMNDEKSHKSYLRKLQNLASNELNGSLWRFVRSVVQLSSVVVFGAIGTFAATSLFAGLSVFRNNSAEKRVKKDLLELYSKEVSAITNKPVSELKIADLETAAYHSNGGKKNAIAIELEALSKNKNRDITVGLIGIVGVAALSAVTASVISASMLTGAGFMMMSTAFGIASNFVFMSAEHIVSKAKGEKVNYSFNAELKELTAQSRLREITSEQVFDLLLKAHPEIGNEIKQKYSEPYMALPAKIKTDIVESYEDRVHAKQLTGMINRAEMNAQELGFIAYGDSSGNKMKAYPKVEAAQSQETINYTANHVDRLNQARLLAQATPTLH